MRIGWPFFMNLDDGRFPLILPLESNSFEGSRRHLLSQLSCLVENSFHQSNHFYVSGSSPIQGAFTRISMFAGSFFLWLSTGSSSNIFRASSGNSRGLKPRTCQYCTQTEHTRICRHNHISVHLWLRSNTESVIPLLITNLANSALGGLLMGAERHAFPILSLAVAIIPPFKNFSSKVLSNSIPPANKEERIRRIAQSQTDDSCQVCSSLAISNITQTRDAIEPKTGIKFPVILDKSLEGENSNMTNEVLVGTGSKNMRIIRIKSLKVYAFGLYVHPHSVCEKLGPKYGFVPVSELENCSSFYEDLLREDIHMTVRLVVNCNGLKISMVRDAFEKSLRARLQKMNPNTDYNCLTAFRSCFTQDIPLPVGTTIDFRQTACGQLITEIGGKQISAVQSKDLCRAFFDMYVGDVPVSIQTKQEIAQNVAGLIRKC